MLLAVTLFAGGLAGFLLWRGGAPLARGVSRLDLRAMAIGVIGFVAALTAIGTGPWGSWVLLLGTLIGLIRPLVGVRRAQCMGFFLVPVMLFYSGYQGAIVSALGLEAKFTPPLPMGAGPVAMASAVSLAVAIACYGLVRHLTGLRAIHWAAVIALAVSAGLHPIFSSLADLSQLVGGRSLRIETWGRDGYKRDLATVWVIDAPDGAECPAEAPAGALEVNRCLVARGSAWAYRARPEYQEEQAKAARSRAGLWREDAPEPPLEWRRR